MAQETQVNNLIINKMTKAQYNNITPSATELYFITDDIGITAEDIPDLSDTYLIKTAGVTDVSLNDLTRQLQKTINGTTSNITQLAFVPGTGTNSAVGGGTGSDLPTASATASLAFGKGAKATNQYAISIGLQSEATNQYAIAIGGRNSGVITPIGSTTTTYVTAAGVASIATGLGSVAEGNYSLACGMGNYAKSGYSIALGRLSYAESVNQVVIGRGNIIDDQEKYALILGNGTISTTTPITAVRSNALTVDWDGNVSLAGSLIVGASSYGNTLPATGTQGQIFFKKLS